MAAVPDEYLERLEREIIEYDGLIAELEAQLTTLKKQRGLSTRRLKRRQHALGRQL